MKRTLSAALLCLLPVLAHADTWVNEGGPYCLKITLVNDAAPVGPSMVGDSFYCPYQSSYFVMPDGGASIYLPGLAVQSLVVVRGPRLADDGSATNFTEVDTFSTPFLHPGFAGSATQHFVRFSYRSCTRYGCRTLTAWANAGGSGEIVEAP